MRSIKARLLVLALAAVTLGWLAAVVFTYFDARGEIEELLDAHLAQAASLLVAQTSHELEEVETEHVRPHKYTRDVAFQIWEDGRKLRLHSANAPDAPLGTGEPGFSDRTVDGVRWRVYSTWDDSRDFLIQVGERAAVRDEIAGDMAEHLLHPLLYALPFLGALLWFAVRRGLSPLARLARDVAQREPGNLAPLDTARPPSEVLPLVEQLNRLFRRVTTSLENERRFTADAAHELRTPIAAVKAQAQVARAARNESERTRALDQAILGCDRTAHLVEQLLTLARLDRPDQVPREPCGLRALATEAVAEIAPYAYEAGISLELEDGAEIEVAGVRELLRVLLRNLVDNAVRYSPAGTTVRISAARTAGRACLTVADEGPGIAEAEREKVLQRFYRSLGTGAPGAGLGLSIVQRVAELHHAELRLQPGDNDHGLRVTVVF